MPRKKIANNQPDFSKWAGVGLPPLTTDDNWADMLDGEAYWKIWQEFRIPFALIKAWGGYKKDLIPDGMSEDLGELLDTLAAKNTAEEMAKVITDERPRGSGMRSKKEAIERAIILELLRFGFAMPIELRHSDSAVYEVVSQLTGLSHANIKQFKQRYMKNE